MAKIPVQHKGKEMSTQGAVREVLKNAGGRISLTQIKEILGMTGPDESARVYKALGNLKKTGAAIRVGQGIYKYQVQKYVPETQAKIWRAMRVSRQFTLRDIVLLSGSAVNYIRRYVRYLIETGYVQTAGKKKDQQIIYRLTEKAGPEVPHYSQKQSLQSNIDTLLLQALEGKTWELTRLVLQKDIKKLPEIKAAVRQLYEGLEGK